jgi:aspartyl-tRNA(Asn)/glutamyl-tRNA(Gln) amidotransferase subunit A
MSVLTQMGVSEIAASVRAKRVSAVDVVGAHLARIAEKDGAVGAFLAGSSEAAKAEARAIDERVARGEDPGPFAGVPIAVKDVINVRGLPTTCGSKILKGFHPPYEATVIQRLKAAGAIVLGKANMDEFAMGSSNENSAYGPVRNPWDPSRVPGGSSGGSAAAVSADFAAMALGSDTGGSIRQPAALCGVVGLKPTYGRVSRYGLVAFASSLDQIGPLTRSCEDAALTLEIIAGQDVHDATSSPRPVDDYRAALTQPTKGLRIGVPRDFLSKGVDPGVMAEFEKTLSALEKDGASLVDVDLPNAPHAIAVYYLVATAEASSNLARFDGVRYGHRAESATRARHLEGHVWRDARRRLRSRGQAPDHSRHLRPLVGLLRCVLRAGAESPHSHPSRLRDRLRFLRCDRHSHHAVTRVQAGREDREPPRDVPGRRVHGARQPRGRSWISVPCGFSNGLPVGFQFVGPSFEEKTLIRAGHAVERLMGVVGRRPVF